MNLSLSDAGVRCGANDLAAIAAGVTALYEHPAYRRLAGDARRSPCALIGASRVEADATVDRVRALLADYEALEKAEAAEIVWEPEAADALRETMRRAAEMARLSLDAFEAAWEELPLLLEAFVTRLAALESSNESRALDTRLDTLRAAADLDPLGVVTALHGEFAPALQGLEETRAAVFAELEQAAVRAFSLAERHAVAAALVSKRDARVLEPATAPLPAAAMLRDLREWREKLAGSAAAGRWSAVRRALAVWARRADELDRRIHAAVAEAEAALAERRQLRGWLHSLRAKAGALGRAECPRFTAAALEVGRLLKAGPTPMPRVRALLAECQALLFHER